MSKASEMATISINGAIRATNVGNTRLRHATFLMTPSVMKISTKTANGIPIRSMAPSGIRGALRQIGRLTAMDTGFGCLRGDGRGEMTRAGVSLRSTMAVGLLRVAA